MDIVVSYLWGRRTVEVPGKGMRFHTEDKITCCSYFLSCEEDIYLRFWGLSVSFISQPCSHFIPLFAECQYIVIVGMTNVEHGIFERPKAKVGTISQY